MSEPDLVLIEVFDLETGEIFELEAPDHTGNRKAFGRFIRGLRSEGLGILTPDAERIGAPPGYQFVPPAPRPTSDHMALAELFSTSQFVEWAAQREAQFGPYQYGEQMFHGISKRCLDYSISRAKTVAQLTGGYTLDVYLPNLDEVDHRERGFGRLLTDIEVGRARRWLA